MNQEIELKFQIDQSSIKPLVYFFDHKNCIKYDSLQLTNRYYDTADHLLRNSRSSLRIRGTKRLAEQSEYEITVKTAGSNLAGLHSRAEYDADLPDDRLDLSVLPLDHIVVGIDHQTLSTMLGVQFSTDFKRQIWLIDYNHSQIEIALDQGYISTNDARLPILEIELELKTGSPVALLNFALELSPFNLHLYSQSKATRGYRLLYGKQLSKVALPNDVNIALSDILHYWQGNEEYALLYSELPFYKEVLLQVAQLLQSIISSSTNHDSTVLKQIYQHWLNDVERIVNIKTFAFSELNTQLKIGLLLILK